MPLTAKKLLCLLHEATSDFSTRAGLEPLLSWFLSPSEPSPPFAYHHSSYSVSLNLTPSSLASLPTISEAGGSSAPHLKCGVIISPLENYCEVQRPGIQSVTQVDAQF